MAVARGYIGVKEAAGAADNPQVLAFWDAADGDKDSKLNLAAHDSSPWCAAYVSAVLEEAGIRSARTGYSLNYNTWGEKLDGPAVGAVVVFSREDPKQPGVKLGHVAFVVGRSKTNPKNLLILGGNQRDMVNIMGKWTQTVLAYRWPKIIAKPSETGLESLPILADSGEISSAEA